MVANGVRVNTVVPGLTDTAMMAGVSDEFKMKIADLMPVGRLGCLDEVAAAAQYLASEEADLCIGMVLDVNGGTCMRWGPANGSPAP